MTTITIHINGKKIRVDDQCSLTQALAAWSDMTTKNKSDTCTEVIEQRYVIALNETFVPKNDYSSTLLNSNDSIELLSPMAGG